MSDITMPVDIAETILASFITYEGQDLASDYKPGYPAHPGDHFGKVFAWYWDNSRSRAIGLFAELLGTARHRGDPVPVRLDDLLRGLRLALPDGYGSQFPAIEAEIRHAMPDHFGGENLNA